jgi:hypothetical protein
MGGSKATGHYNGNGLIPPPTSILAILEEASGNTYVVASFSHLGRIPRNAHKYGLI